MDTHLLRVLFSKSPFFSKLDDASLELLAEKFRPARYAAGEVICEEGDEGKWAFIVVLGEIAVIKKARDGSSIEVNALRTGDWGGMMSLFGSHPRSARLVVRRDTELLALDYEALELLLEQMPQLAMGLLGVMSRRLEVDAIHLAATLRSVNVTGLQEFYRQSTPEERLLLDTIHHRVAIAESLGEIMAFLYDSIRLISPCDLMTLSFLDERAARLTVYWARGEGDLRAIAPGHAEDLTDSSLVRCLETGRPRTINDLRAYLRDKPGSNLTRLLVDEGMQSAMACPLVTGSRAVGFLVRSSRQTNAYDDHQVRLQMAIAGSISQPVEKSYRIEQLTQANHAYGEMLGFVSHELQSPIASIVTDCRLLADGYLGPLTEKQHEKLDRAISKGEYLLGIVRDYLHLARLEDANLEADCRATDMLQEVLNPAVEMVNAERIDKQMTLETDVDEPLPAICADAGLLRVALLNLLRNAVKYGREGGLIRLTARVADDEVRVSVWNEGPGFPDDQRGRLFRRFTRLNTPETKRLKGNGVGLYSAWRIVQLHGGRIDARSVYGQWAEFYFSLPVARRNASGRVTCEET